MHRLKRPFEFTFNHFSWPFYPKTSEIAGSNGSESSSNNDDQMVCEETTIDWEIDLPLALDGFETKEFETGSTSALPTKWQFFTKLIKLRNKEYMGVFLRLHESQASSQARTAKFSLEVVHPDGPKFEAPRKYLFQKQESWGLKDFLDTDLIDHFKSEDGKLKLKLRVSVFDPPKNPKQAEEDEPLRKRRKEVIDMHFHKCTKDIFSVLENYQWADLVLKPPEEEEGLKVHRFALAARSAYFKRKFSTVPLPPVIYEGPLPALRVDHSRRIMGVIVCYIHGGVLGEPLVDPEHTTIEFAEELLNAAVYYEVEGLRDFLLEFYPGLKARFEKRKGV